MVNISAVNDVIIRWRKGMSN